jgi:integrase/recombinase XerD
VQVIRRDSGEAQLEVLGKGVRQVLVPAEIAARLLASRVEAPASPPVFASVRNPGHALTERTVNYVLKDAAERAGVNPAASVHWLRHAHALDASTIVRRSRWCRRRDLMICGQGHAAEPR